MCTGNCNQGRACDCVENVQIAEHEMPMTIACTKDDIAWFVGGIVAGLSMWAGIIMWWLS